PVWRKLVPYSFQIHFRDTLSILHYTKFLTVPRIGRETAHAM
ncbi:UNVERIFIED_ORG: hypothetical protein BDK47_13640, partial [Anoxybacillus amylolyticus]